VFRIGFTDRVHLLEKDGDYFCLHLFTIDVLLDGGLFPPSSATAGMPPAGAKEIISKRSN
jgi:hypothetical protein